MDGRSVPIERRDGLFQTVRVPAGSHEVRFSYRPPYMLWGLVALVLGCAWLVLGPRVPGAGRARRSASSTGA